jgi:hypothetical protein
LLLRLEIEEVGPLGRPTGCGIVEGSGDLVVPSGFVKCHAPRFRPLKKA